MLSNNPLKTNRVLPALVLTLIIAFIGLTTFASPGKVDAHAVSLASSPAANEQLAQAPESISIQFSEPIEASVSTIQLWDASPREIPLGTPEAADEETLTVAIPEDLAPGLYTVIWRNLSTVDAHTWAGSFPFIVLGPNGEVPEGGIPLSLQQLAEPPSDRPSTLESVARWIVLLGSAIILGGASYVAFVAMPSARVLSEGSVFKLAELSRRILVVTAAIAAFFVLQGSLVQLVLQADDLGGLGKTDNLLFDTRQGHYLIARQVLVVLALLGVVWLARAKSRSGVLAGLSVILVSSFGVLMTQSLVSHAAGGSGEFWKVGADILHLLAASLWIGALIHIGLAMPRWLDELQGPARTIFAAESFRRFSLLAAFSVVILMVSGVFSALVQFTSWEQLWDTTYGWSLIGKLAAMLPLLAVAGLNAFFLQPRVVDAAQYVGGGAGDDEPPGAQAVTGLHRLLVNAVRVEAVLGIAVLVAVAVLIQLQPPRAIAEAEAATGGTIVAPNASTRDYYLKAVQSGGLVVSLRVDPAQVGNNEFEVGLGSEFGGVGEIEDIRLDFDHEEEDIGQSTLPLDLAGSAKFVASGSNLSLPGNYNVTATVRRRGEDEDVKAEFDLPVAGTGGPSASSSDSSDSVWDWPFEGRRSVGAIMALSAGAVGLVAAGAWQGGRLRRRS